MDLRLNNYINSPHPSPLFKFQRCKRGIIDHKAEFIPLFPLKSSFKGEYQQTEEGK